MEIRILKPRKALNKAFLKVKPNRTEIESFKTNLSQLLDRINDNESEEFHKNLVSDFLKDTYYKQNHFINTKGRNDLVIHNTNSASGTVGVIIEAKKPTNKAEMLTKNKVNVKAFQELVLYYLRERITQKNIEIKYLIATNINEWFIFDATLFDRLFAQNKNLVKQFNDFECGRLADTKTDFFYKQVAEPFIAEIKHDIEFTYFDIRDYEKPLRNADKKDDNQLIALFKLLSPEHLLKLPFANDSNSLDKRFYGELLHIIGLTETKDGSKKLIERNKEGERNTGSFLENAIIQLDSLDKISRIENPSQFGSNLHERLFNVGLELSITWINRILFLKLLEAQLITYHKGDKSYEFLSFDKIKDYDDLNSLFFQVLARKQNERNEDVKTLFAKVPYLNSSLFEPTEIEHSTLFISQLRNDKTIPIYSQTVLKDTTGKRRTGNINPLEYLFEFLNDYDFASEGSEEIQEDNKTLINASVLGLIFEKINGYKDGSFFTPGFITMYMCRETIRKAVVQKFNETKNWNCTDIDSLYDKIEDRKEANKIINDLKICDPAVGSGHFLVSALNEMIAIKSDLKILQDRDGKRLKEYHFEVVNDELIVTDEDGELFEYIPKNKESQRIQETLFHEKQTIIENCLFGVDLNPNSVKICRLRLWIELLKNAYYKNETELETLPNIDINIKCGNSLISRFALDADLKQALKKSASKWTIDSYRLAVDTYRNAQSKEQKREMERLINEIKTNFRSEISLNDPKAKRLRALNGELFSMTNQGQLFELSKKEKDEWNAKVAKLTAETQKLEAEIEEIKSNKIYENAFEWRFEFPEVLDDNGDFIGFNVVIGNPPYVFGGNEGISENEKKFFKINFETGSGKVNLFTLFIERAFSVLKSSSHFGFIIPNTFLRVTSYDSTRKYLVKNSKIDSIYDFGDKVFDDAVTTAIVITATKGQYNDFQTNIINDSNTGILSKQEIIDNEFVIAINLNKNSQNLVKKLKSNILLGSICKEMIFGVVITKNKEEVVSNTHKKGWKPFLEGKEIGSYFIKEVKQWLNYDHKLLHRARTKEIFETPEKILVQRITGGSKPLKAAYDNQSLYNKESINNIILKDDSPVKTKFILALLNSKLINWFYTMQFTNESNLTVNLSKTYLSQIPIALPTNETVFISIVDEILLIKKENNLANTQALEDKLDRLIYQLYDLTQEEIKIIENTVK
ncbi:MAG TPA: type II restriction endonuclease [Marinilabiliales bacterium]|nr:MAG: type II restriction endonuclease [Bacteroidetes bacterium GWD2_40_43]OFX94679.1 MAG: type II restriction endonuclease [Bacteroidetes bacterium GWE2_40_63]OFY24792.1 MAG: type II restriction endonuclease [Bacteroidetes bacterium GWF2_40_13]OFZ24445.1 MAG: type II restriction endonuclease [Bacteroidetes bacterium RIFOXYC2_FULL_40_12]HAM98446.1 type II restriction endonuclease [Marinilabiliales bacterium]